MEVAAEVATKVAINLGNTLLVEAAAVFRAKAAIAEVVEVLTSRL